MAVSQGIKPLISREKLEKLKASSLLGKSKTYIAKKEPYFVAHARTVSNKVASHYATKYGLSMELTAELADEFYEFILWGYFACDASRDIDFDTQWKEMWGSNDTTRF